MNSCSDLALNFVSGSCIVTYRINTRIREVLKKSQLKMGRDLNACFICMFCRAAISTDHCFGRCFGLCWFWCSCLSLNSGECVWWCDIWSSAFSPRHSLQWRTMCWRFCGGVSCHLHARGLHQPWICHGGICATVLQSVFCGLQSDSMPSYFGVFLLFENKNHFKNWPFIIMGNYLEHLQTLSNSIFCGDTYMK